jgi:hypothetical protein
VEDRAQERPNRAANGGHGQQVESPLAVDDEEGQPRRRPERSEPAPTAAIPAPGDTGGHDERKAMLIGELVLAGKPALPVVGLRAANDPEQNALLVVEDV